MRGSTVIAGGVAALLLATTVGLARAEGSAVVGHVSAHTAPAGRTDTDQAARETVTFPADASPVAVRRAEREDLRTIARDLEISLSESVRRFGWQTAFGRVVNAVEEAYPSTYAGSHMRTGKTLEGLVEVTGAVPPNIGELVSGVPVPVTIVGGASYSETERTAAVATAHYAAYRHPFTDGDVQTHYDDRTASIVLTIRTEAGLSKAERASRADTISRRVQRALVRDDAPAIDVTIKYATRSGRVEERAPGTAW